MKKTLLALVSLFICFIGACSNQTKQTTITTSNTTSKIETTKTTKTTQKPTTSITTEKVVPITHHTEKPINVVADSACPVGEVDGWIPVFCDEFEGTSLNKNNWNYEQGNGEGGWGNNEVQYYTNREDNVKVSDGYLTITAKKENYGGFEYTSGRITTKSKVTAKYGKIEARIKLPKSGGTWSAFWMMPQSSVYGTWPKSGEIDIMEQTGNNYNNILGTVHTGTYHGDGTGGRYTGSTTTTTEFHTYGIIWDANKIEFQFDGETYFSTTQRADRLEPLNHLDIEPSQIWPFDQNFFLILNVAVGGNLGGRVSNFTSDSMIVDYVRVYQKDYAKNDEEAPTVVKNIQLIDVGQKEAWIKFDKGTDDQAVRGYNIYLNNEFYKFVERNFVQITNLEARTNYKVSIETLDYSNKVSGSKEFSFETLSYPVVPGRVEAENSNSYKNVVVDYWAGRKVLTIVDTLTPAYAYYILEFEESGEYQLNFRAICTKEFNIQIKVGSVQLDTLKCSPTTNDTTWIDYTGPTFTVERDEESDYPGRVVIKIQFDTVELSVDYIEIIKK